MAFTEVADLNCSVSYALGGFDKKNKKDNPTRVEGYYIGTRQVVSPKSKGGFASLHVIQTKEGNHGIWGKTDLDNKMKSVSPGQAVRIIFKGMVETKNNPMYSYSVQVDRENTIDVGAADLSTASEAYNDYGADDSITEEDLDDSSYQDELQVAPPQRPTRTAQAPSAASQNHVLETLRNRQRRSG